MRTGTQPIVIPAGVYTLDKAISLAENDRWQTVIRATISASHKQLNRRSESLRHVARRNALAEDGATRATD